MFIQVANDLLLKRWQLYNSQSIVRAACNREYFENESNIVNMHRKNLKCPYADSSRAPGLTSG